MKPDAPQVNSNNLYNLTKPTSKIRNYIIIGITVLAVILVAVGTVVALSLINKSNSNSNQNQNQTTTSSADDLMNQAIKSLHSDKTKAKTLLEEALQKYQAAGNENGVINVKAQLDLLDRLK